MAPLEGGAGGGVSIFAGSVQLFVVAVPGIKYSWPLSLVSHTAWQFWFFVSVLHVCVPHACGLATASCAAAPITNVTAIATTA